MNALNADKKLKKDDRRRDRSGVNEPF